MLIMQQGEFVCRDNFSLFLNKRRLLNEAVEVGTHRGAFARVILERWYGRMLYCVDPWNIPEGYQDQAEMLIAGCGGALTRDEDLKAAMETLAPYNKYCTLLRETSEGALPKFADSSLDFVYLDGDHREAAVANDLAWWWEKLKPGGVIAGHDIVSPGEIGGGWGPDIQPPVFAFAAKHGLTIYLVVELTCSPWSYYLIKE